jgi:hypothetical protein
MPKELSLDRVVVLRAVPCLPRLFKHYIVHVRFLTREPRQTNKLAKLAPLLYKRQCGWLGGVIFEPSRVKSRRLLWV